MKKLIYIILAFILILPLASCSSSSATTPATTPAPNKVEVKIIADKNGVKITYAGMKLTQYLPNQSDGYMLTVGLIIENNSGADITVFPMNSSVNGVMKTAVSGMPLTALNEKKAISGFSFANLSGTGINSVKDSDKIKNVEFQLSVMNNNNSATIFMTDKITLKP